VPFLLGFFRDYSPHTYKEILEKGMYPDRPHLRVVQLEIDWTASDRKLKADFANWLATKRCVPRSTEFKYKGAKEKPGPQKNIDQELVYLAIYRAKKAGYDAKSITQLLAPLLTGLNYCNRVGLNPQRVYDACTCVQELLKTVPI